MKFQDENDPVPFDPQVPHTAPLEPAAASPLASAASEFSQAPLPGFSRSAARALPEDLRVPWNWIDLLLLCLITFCAIFCLSFLFALGLGVFGFHPTDLQKSTTVRNFFAVIVQIALDLFLLGYLAAQMHFRFGLPFWRAIGWRPLPLDGPAQALIYTGLAFAGIFLQAVVNTASSAFVPKRQLPIQAVLQERHTATLFMMVAILIAPLVEEVVFRGYIYPVVARTFGITTSVLATGILFGLLHAPQLWGGWWQITLLVIVGIIFTLVRAVSKTIVPTYILHTGYNSVQVFVWLIGTYGLRHFPFGR